MSACVSIGQSDRRVSLEPERTDALSVDNYEDEDDAYVIHVLFSIWLERSAK